MKKKKEIKKVDPDKLPSIFQPMQRRELKDTLIKKYIDEFTKVRKVGGQEHKPNDKDTKEYLKSLENTSLKDLQLMGSMKHYPLKLDMLDRLKSIDKKKFAVVTIFNDNKTTDTGVCHCYSRTFSRNNMSYIVMSERSIYDPEFKMAHFYYYANNPFPIVFQKQQDPLAITDGRLLDSIIEMKVIEALANVDIDKKINLVMFFCAITMFVSVINLILTLKASGVIGG